MTSTQLSVHPFERRQAGTKPRRRAFAIQELAVVIGALALLTAVAIPSLTSIEHHAWDVVCLRNLAHIGQAMHQYANDDRFDQAVPLGLPMVRRQPSLLFPQDFGWRTAEAFAYGGRTAIQPLDFGDGELVRELMSIEDGSHGYWTAEHRPLNKYIDADPTSAQSAFRVYRCPADKGVGLYPDFDPEQRAFDVLGNCYRLNRCGVVSAGALDLATSSVYGHRLSSIASPPSETVLLSEPIFYWFAGAPPGTVPDTWGWHRRFRADDVLYLDGSARFTRTDPGYEFSDEELADMGYTPSVGPRAFLRRGPTYRVDCYPTPGAVILRALSDDTLQPNPFQVQSYFGWPFEDAQHNLPLD